MITGKLIIMTLNVMILTNFNQSFFFFFSGVSASLGLLSGGSTLQMWLLLTMG